MDTVTNASGNSMDTVTNASGNRLIELCLSFDLRIVYGRIGECGQFTNIIAYGKSLIDYALASVDLFPVISTFKVHDMSSLSSHLPISVNLCLPVRMLKILRNKWSLIRLYGMRIKPNN